MTDVVMPEMNGRDLAEKITDIYPDIRLLFMSGYTADVIAHHGALDKGVPFIHKPFSMAVQRLETTNTQLEKKLLESGTLSEEVMTYMSEGFVLTDTRASIIFINKSLSEMLGYLPEEIIGKRWLDMVPIEQQAIAKDAEVRRTQGHTDRYEIILHRKNGEKFPGPDYPDSFS
jgi:PAS domain S-box-containing protein